VPYLIYMIAMRYLVPSQGPRSLSENRDFVIWATICCTYRQDWILHIVYKKSEFTFSDRLLVAVLGCVAQFRQFFRAF
jgi:hypothetical protein